MFGREHRSILVLGAIERRQQHAPAYLPAECDAAAVRCRCVRRVMPLPNASPPQLHAEQLEQLCLNQEQRRAFDARQCTTIVLLPWLAVVAVLCLASLFISLKLFVTGIHRGNNHSKMKQLAIIIQLLAAHSTSCTLCSTLKDIHPTCNPPCGTICHTPTAQGSAIYAGPTHVKFCGESIGSGGGALAPSTPSLRLPATHTSYVEALPVTSEAVLAQGMCRGASSVVAAAEQQQACAAAASKRGGVYCGGG